MSKLVLLEDCTWLYMKSIVNADIFLACDEIWVIKWQIDLFFIMETDYFSLCDAVRIIRG